MSDSVARFLPSSAEANIGLIEASCGEGAICPGTIGVTKRLEQSEGVVTARGGLDTRGGDAGRRYSDSEEGAPQSGGAGGGGRWVGRWRRLDRQGRNTVAGEADGASLMTVGTGAVARELCVRPSHRSYRALAVRG